MGAPHWLWTPRATPAQTRSCLTLPGPPALIPLAPAGLGGQVGLGLP